MGGERRELTIFMSDLRGFTSISQNLHPEKVVRLLNIYFNGMLQQLSQFGVTVDKFIGDGILGYVPSLNQSSASEENDTAVWASIGMLQKMEEVNRELQEEGLPVVEIGIGICRGPVVLGNIGTASKLQYTIIGDSVNRAARIEGLCKTLACPLILEKKIWESLGPGAKGLFASLGAHLVPGIDEKIEVYGWTQK